jgi:hypothetical protein
LAIAALTPFRSGMFNPGIVEERNGFRVRRPPLA